MQLFASKMTELAQGQVTSSSAKTVSTTTDSQVGGNEQLELNRGNAFDEHFKESLTNTETDHALSAFEKAPVDSSDIVKAEPNTDWHELVSQSQSMDTDLTNTDSAKVQYTEHSKSDIDANNQSTNSKNELITNLNEQEFSEDDKQIDEALLSILQAQQAKEASLAGKITSRPNTAKPDMPELDLATMQNKLANGVKLALNISPEDTTLSDTTLSDTTLSDTNAALSVTSNQLSDMSSLVPDTDKPTFEMTSTVQTQQGELTAQLSSNEQLPKEQVEGTVASDIEQSLLQFSAKQLEQVAQHIFSRLEQGQKNLGDAQHFVSNLKSGLAEIKSQLQDGRVAGIDLSTLVQESLPKTDVVAVKLEQVVQQVSNTIGLLSMNTMSTAGHIVDTSQAGMSPSMDGSRQSLEVSLGQLEQTKSSQQTQNPLDKSVNLFKPEGQQQLADKVRWMNNNRQISAELRLDPEDLGAIQVKISMNGDAATVSMVVQSSQARDALEQATPRLREMLAEQGLSLGESSVNQDNSDGKQGQYMQQEGHQNENVLTKIDESIQTGNIIAEQTIKNGSIGGIDYYA